MNDHPHSHSEAEPTGNEGSGFWSSRLGLDALKYRIPIDSTTLGYSLGAATFVCFVILVLTGFWLAQFYNPNPSAAHDSVIYIITRAPFGDIARNLHYWAASVMVVTIVAHIGWVFYRRAYRAPREITWYAGVALAGLVFLIVVTGTVLRYDQEGFEALAHFLAGGELTGQLGRFFTDGFTISTPTLARIFSLHTSLLPLGIVALIGLHFWLVKELGISGASPRSVMFSNHLPRIAGLGLMLFVLVAVLAILAPEGLGHRPVAGYEITKPFWPVLWIYALESVFGMWALVWSPLVVFLFFAVVPLIDRGSPQRTTLVALRTLGAALLVVLFALVLWAGLSPPQQHLGM